MDAEGVSEEERGGEGKVELSLRPGERRWSEGGAKVGRRNGEV